MKKWILTSIFFSVFQTANAQILPDNDLHLQDNLGIAANMTEEEFNHIVDSVVNRWKPTAKTHGGNLSAVKNWKDATVNASAIQLGPIWAVNMYGGLARRPEITADGFTLVVCHELGHHFAGYPFHNNLLSPNMASEGQADYFATQFCARQIWANQREYNQKFRASNELPTTAKEKCDQVWKDMDSQNLCYRVALAGKSLATLLAALKKNPAMPDFGTADKSEVPQTQAGHPQAQCRLDTYFSGALCSVAFDGAVIPGKKAPGKASPAAEEDAAKYSCMSKAGFKEGFRPRCWFKPLI